MAWSSCIASSNEGETVLFSKLEGTKPQKEVVMTLIATVGAALVVAVQWALATTSLGVCAGVGLYFGRNMAANMETRYAKFMAPRLERRAERRQKRQAEKHEAKLQKEQEKARGKTNGQPSVGTMA